MTYGIVARQKSTRELESTHISSCINERKLEEKHLPNHLDVRPTVANSGALVQPTENLNLMINGELAQKIGQALSMLTELVINNE